VRQCSNRDSPSFYGQHQEDRLLLGEFFCGKMGGTYLEIGAFDGVTFSNTKFFEDAMGWSGLLIEGQPETAEKLRRSRGAIGSNNFVVDMGVCSERGTMDFTPKSTPTAGDPNHMSDDFKERWHSDFEGNALSVPCAPLSDMLSDTGVKKLDLFVLDVEGGEFEVIKTMDWTVEVCVWLVEMDGTNPEKDSNVENILVENGYVRSTSSLFWEDASDGEYHGGGQNVAFLAQDLPACLAK
jgi:FkbM family methyltransferase